jgi:cell shape-determining protein MreD
MGRSDADIARTRALWTANKPGETAAPAYVGDPPAWWLAALALGAALLLQSTLLAHLQLRGATIPFVTLIVAWYGLRTGTVSGLAFGLVAGACEDALAGSTGAAWTFATGLIGLACGRIHGTWLADVRLALVPGAALVTFLRYCIFAVALQMEGRTLAQPLAHLHAALWQSLLGGVLALALLIAFPSLLAAHAHRR